MSSALFTVVGSVAAAGAATAFWVSQNSNSEFNTIRKARTMGISDIALLLKIRRPHDGAWVHVKGVIDIPVDFVQTSDDSAVAMLEQVYEDWVVCQEYQNKSTSCHRERRNTKSELSTLSRFDIKQYADDDILGTHQDEEISAIGNDDTSKPLILSKVLGDIDLNVMKTALARAQMASNPRIAVAVSSNVGLHNFPDGEYAINDEAEEVAAFLTNAGSSVANDTSSATTLVERLQRLPQVFPALQQGGSVHLGSLHEVWSLNKGDPVDVVGMACITPGETVAFDAGAPPPAGAPQALYALIPLSTGVASVQMRVHIVAVHFQYIGRGVDDGTGSVTSAAGKDHIARTRSLPMANMAYSAGWICLSVALGAALCSMLSGGG